MLSDAILAGDAGALYGSDELRQRLLPGWHKVIGSAALAWLGRIWLPAGCCLLRPAWTRMVVNGRKPGSPTLRCRLCGLGQDEVSMIQRTVLRKRHCAAPAIRARSVCTLGLACCSGCLFGGNCFASIAGLRARSPFGPLRHYGGMGRRRPAGTTRQYLRRQRISARRSPPIAGAEKARQPYRPEIARPAGAAAYQAHEG